MQWRKLPAAVQLLGIGWYVAACIVAGVLVGLGVDTLVDSEPLFTMLGLFLGLATAGYGGYRMIMDFLGSQQQGPKGPEDR